MVKVIRYNTITSIPGIMKLEGLQLPTCEPVGEYQVDTSHFVPQCESGAVVLRAGEAGQGIYDFQDGRDTGVPIPSNRRHGYTGDPAEASVNNRESVHSAKDSVETLKMEYVNDMASKAADAARASAAASSSWSAASSG